MSQEQVGDTIEQFRAALSASSRNVPEICRLLASFAYKHFDATLITVSDLASNEIYTQRSPDFEQPDNIKPLCGNILDKLPLFVSDIDRSRAPQTIKDQLAAKKINSFAAASVYSAGKPRLLVEISHQHRYYKWRKEDMQLVEQVASLLDLAISGEQTIAESLPIESSGGAPVPISNTEGSYQRLAKYGNLLFIKISVKFQIIEILGDTKKIIGLEPDQLIKNLNVWQRLIDPEDLKRLRREFARMRFMQHEFREEVRLRSVAGKDERLLFVQVIPINDASGNTLFWEGFAVDITDKRRAEQELRNQSKRIEALYEVAQSTQVYHDPALVMLKGLRALIKATNSDCGLGCFYDAKTKRIELAALEGLSQFFMQEFQNKINDSNLLNKAIHNKETILLKNIQEEPLASIDLARKEGLKSSLIVPLVLDDKVSGALVLYCKTEGRYTKNDENLVKAAATQIAIASRQAEYFIAEKQQSQYMALLYRISHELSKYTSAKEIAQHSIPLIQKQFASKRIWIGVINEQLTHLVGMAGFGPGVRQRLIEMQIELYLRHDFLDQALKTSRPVIVKEGQEMECSGLNSIINRLQLGTFVIVPLVSLNQTVGAVIIEPAVSSEALIEKNLSLLSTICHEIASTILGRKFEAKITESEKMRMAGLLASGVAHNFNNLLQAVMGQASLLEMQLPKDSTLSKSAHMIVEAAGKGASLVNQLLNFSSQDTVARRELEISELFEESGELYKSIIGNEIKLTLSVAENLPKIEVDYSQIQQVMSNVLINARDAIQNKPDGKISIKAKRVKVLSGEIDPDLAPGEYIRIDIEDNGIGMDEERQKRCFEPFYSSKHFNSQNGMAIDGSGLGLSYAYSIMKQHNGIITVRSQLGRGSVFSLYFPVPTPVTAKLQSGDSQGAAVSQIRSVYLCELDQSIRQTVKPIFESLSLKCAVINCDPKSDELKTDGEDPAALIIDVDKQSFHTIPFLQKVHKTHAGLLIVILTQDIRRWSNILSSYKNIYAVSKPLNVWGIHALARKIINHAKERSLNSTIEVEKSGAADSNGASPSSTEAALLPGGENRKSE